jgi:SH3-like domain-containing protein
MVEIMWDEVKCQSVAKKEPKNPEMGQSEDKGTRNGKDKSGAVPKLMPNQLSKLQKISSLTDDSPRKRKVADTSMEMDARINPYKKRESLEVANLKEAMDAVTRIGGKINKVVKNLYHPKTELVDLVAKLNKWAAVFQKESLKAWMEAHKYEPVEKAMIDVDTQADVEREIEINKRKATTRNIGCQIDFTSRDNKSNNKNEEKKDMACQTETRSREGNRLETLQGIDTLEKWVAAEKKEWSGEVYTNTSVLVGNPLVDVKDSIVKAVLVEPTDAAMDLSIQRLYRNRFPELASVKEEWAVLEQITQLEGAKPIRRKVFRIGHLGTDLDVWEKINRLREETRNEERIAIHHVQCMSVQRLQKMVETVFHGTKTYVIIYTTKQRNEEKEEGGPQDGRKKSNGLRERKSEALIIDPGDGQYADLLKKVKLSVAGTTAKEAIQSVRKTQTGKLLLTVGKGTGQARLLKEQLEKKIGSFNARIAERTETIYVLGVDALVTPQEVVEAIKTEEGVEGHIEQPMMRPTQDGNQVAVVKVSGAMAKKLVEKGKIRVGLAVCRIREKIIVPRCRKCWQFGHAAGDCTSRGGGVTCFNCGAADHKAKEC